MEKYLDAVIEALHPFGDVLEVGFSPASSLIQKYHPKSHTLIESNADEAKKWAKKHPTVKIVEGIWQAELPELGVFDTVFFGIDPIETHFLTRIRYLDHDLDAFCKGVEPKNKKALSRFLAELEQNGQITAEQKEKMVEKYDLTQEKPPAAKRSNQMLLFLKECLALHMRKGSRFSCFLKSELNDPQFFDEIVVDPTLDYREDGRIIVIEKF